MLDVGISKTNLIQTLTHKSLFHKQAESAKASGEESKTLAKCMKIAISIMRGDVVPLKDQQYLQKNNQELFAQAMKMRMPKEKPEKCKSVLEEEDETNDEASDATKLLFTVK